MFKKFVFNINTSKPSFTITHLNLIKANSFKTFFSGSKKTSEEVDDQLETKYKELLASFNEQKNRVEILKDKIEEIQEVYGRNKETLEIMKIRNEKELKSLKEFAITKFAKDLLDIHDNFGRALKCVPETDLKHHSEEEQVEIFKNFVEGINLTKASFEHIMVKHGITEYIPTDEKYDEDKHELVNTNEKPVNLI